MKFSFYNKGQDKKIGALSLSPSMRMFGTAINDEFGDVEESGILIAVDEILEEKKYRHIHSFLAQG